MKIEKMLPINNKWLKIILIFLPLCFCLLISVSQSYAENNNWEKHEKMVILNDKKTEYCLALNLEFLEDKSKQLTINDVSPDELNKQFIPNLKLLPNLGVKKSAIWVRFKVKKQEKLSKK